MALAYLCAQLHREYPDIKVTDNPVANYRAFVIDHALREGSAEEASSVARALRRLDVTSEVWRINWKKELGVHVDIQDVSNIESVARRARYRRLGNLCAHRNIATVLLAHHEDDQYEGVLMRLVAGHRNSGLAGMREANPIPECEGIFGAWGSGWVDDQNSRHPFYSTALSKRERRHLKSELKYTLAPEAEERMAYLDDSIDFDLDEPVLPDPKHPEPLPSLAYLPIEDGGCSIYRPLLQFGKDRLIATCLENNVPWWEDHTNSDPTLTRRNAIRHMFRSCELPRALQKPTILALSKTMQRRAKAHEAEARRLLQRCLIHEFQPHAGTLLIQFPNLTAFMSTRHSKTKQRLSRWRLWKRHVVGALLQRIIAMVSPETQTPAIANLLTTIERLFPSLAEPSKASAAPPAGSFNIGGVNFLQIESSPQTVAPSPQAQSQTWYVSRQPYVSVDPRPYWRVPYWSMKRIGSPLRRDPPWQWSNWMPWRLWDGRFWIRMLHRLPYRVVVMPFMVEHAKAFRDALAPNDRLVLNKVLKRCAPAKVRYTLPAIYSEEYLDLDDVRPRERYPLPEYDAETEEEECRRNSRRVDPAKMRLLALPTLDIQLPGLRDWLSYDLRYKRVDRDTLRAAGSFSRSIFKPPRSRRDNKTRHVGSRRRSKARPAHRES
jgi:tRNA(Ile)-lysidine synthase